MRELPILFSGAMVNAILADKKTMTRRVIKPLVGAETIESSGYSFFTPDKTVSIRGTWHGMGGCEWFRKPLAIPGDRLWIRETWQKCLECGRVNYKADANEGGTACQHCDEFLGKWKPSIFMFREYNRITLEVTAVRAERLHSITESDAEAEGMLPCGSFELGGDLGKTAVLRFSELWDKINGKKHPWKDNPAVWVYTFKRITP